MSPQCIVVLDETLNPSNQLILAELRKLSNASVMEVGSAPELLSQLKAGPVSMLVVFVDECLSVSSKETISKSRSNLGYRDAQLIFLHNRYSDTGIQTSLMAGAHNIYVAPFDREQFMHTIRSELDDTPYGLRLIPPMETIHPEHCQVQLFGRVSKILIKPAGNLQIETNAVLYLGQKIQIHSDLALDQQAAFFSYEVSARLSGGNYYRYKNAYELNWLADSDMKDSFENWLKDNSKNFVLPKTKVLFIGDNCPTAITAALSTTLFSLYSKTSGHVTSNYLHQLGPRIIIGHELPDISFAAVESYAHETLQQKNLQVLCIATQTLTRSGWSFLDLTDLEQFAKKFIALAKPCLSERVSHSVEHAKYVDRRSRYSRFSLMLDATLMSIEENYLVLSLSSPVEIGSIVRVSLNPSHHLGPLNPPIEIFVRTLKLTQEDHPSPHYICMIIPVSSEPELCRAQWMNWVNTVKNPLIDSANVSDLVSPVSVVPTPDPRETQYSSTQTKSAFTNEINEALSRLPKWAIDWGKVAFGLLVSALVAVLIYQGMPKQKIVGKTPAGVDETLRAIRKAFK